MAGCEGENMAKETIKSVLKDIRDILKNRLSVQTAPAIEKQPEDARFICNPDGTITDKELNLIWHPTLDKKYIWAKAKIECEKIGYRMPSRKELESLLDLTKYGPAINKEIFSDTKTDDWYWSGDSCTWNLSLAWYVYFHSGTVSTGNKDASYYVRPVRSN
jgi:hypothetical protein